MYWVSVFTEAGIFAVLALGLDMIWGWSGDFDLAFYGYLALGSYMTFVLTIGKPTPPVQYILGWHLPVVLAILLAVVVVVGLAAIIGAIALRNLRDIYFAVTTLGAVSALYLVVENYTPLFDGYNGVYGLVNPGQTALRLTYNGYRVAFLGVVLVVLFLAYLLVQRLSRSPFGRMLRAVREDERAASAYGRRVFFAKYRAYLFGAALAGLAGGLFAIFISAFNPSAWTPQELLVIYAAILIGGRGNPRGVIVGVFVVYVGLIELTRFLPSPASRPDFSPAMRQVLIGLMIILMLRFRPDGIFRERPGVDQTGRPARRLAGPFRARPLAGAPGAAAPRRRQAPARAPARRRCLLVPRTSGRPTREAPDEHGAAGNRAANQVLRRHPCGSGLHLLRSRRAGHRPDRAKRRRQEHGGRPGIRIRPAGLRQHQFRRGAAGWQAS